jgi:hypothetical protein
MPEVLSRLNTGLAWAVSAVAASKATPLASGYLHRIPHREFPFVDLAPPALKGLMGGIVSPVKIPASARCSARENRLDASSAAQALPINTLCYAPHRLCKFTIR